MVGGGGAGYAQNLRDLTAGFAADDEHQHLRLAPGKAVSLDHHFNRCAGRYTFNEHRICRRDVSGQGNHPEPRGVRQLVAGRSMRRAAALECFVQQGKRSHHYVCVKVVRVKDDVASGSPPGNEEWGGAAPVPIVHLSVLTTKLAPMRKLHDVFNDGITPPNEPLFSTLSI